MGLSVWRETSKKLTVYRVCYTPIETLFLGYMFEIQKPIVKKKGIFKYVNVRLNKTFEYTLDFSVYKGNTQNGVWRLGGRT